MDHIEMVEKLMARANVGYEEARAALERSDWDLLDAMVELEKRGKVKGGASYSTAGSSADAPKYDTVHATASDASKDSGWKNFCDGVRRIFKKSWVNSFSVTRCGETMLTMPILVFLLLIVCCFWITLPLLIVGLFFGCRYRFEGKDIKDDDINRVMAKATDAAESVKESIKSAAADDQRKNGEA